MNETLVQSDVLALACSFGRCDENGVVYIKTSDGERVVGQWTLEDKAGDPLVFYGRRFIDLLTEVRLIDVRLKEGSVTPPIAQASVLRIRKVCEAPNFVGDLDLLNKELDSIDSQVMTLLTQFEEKKAAERAAAKAAKETLAARAEALADSRSWKTASAEFTQIIEQWKSLPRSNKNADTKIWKRISKARSTYEKNRRTHFAERKKQSAEAMTAKNDLISEAETLATSTDWDKSSRTLAQLMQKWKTSPRADRKTEEKLWLRFSAARDTFFAAKRAHDESLEAAAKANLPKAQELISRIEALKNSPDTRTARSALIPLLDEFDKVGSLPKSSEKELARRIRVVQDHIKTQEQSERKRNDPEKSGRASSAADQLRARVATAEKAISQARSEGNTALVTELEAQIETQRAMLEAAEAVMKEFATTSHA